MNDARHGVTSLKLTSRTISYHKSVRVSLNSSCSPYLFNKKSSYKRMIELLYSANLITRNIMPENQEFPMLSLSSRITPENLFFIRNHFPYPKVNMRSWGLIITGWRIFLYQKSASRTGSESQYHDCSLHEWKAFALPTRLSS